MDVTRILEADHRQVETLFEQIEKADGKERTALVTELATAVRGHMELEETVLYPAMKPVTGEDAAEEGVNEHDLARSALDEVEKLAPDGPGFEGALETMKAAITHHVEDEEGEMFPTLRKDGERVLDKVATPFMTKRLELGLPMEGPALAAASTKEELLEEAEKAGVDSPSTKTKDELAEALAEVMS